MKSLFIKVAITGLALFTSVNVYGHKEDLLKTDPRSSLRIAMKERASEVYSALQEAEHQANPYQPIDHCLFDRHEPVPEPVLSEEEQNERKKAYLKSDNIALEQAKSVLKDISKGITKVKKTLKTAAARTVLDAMLQESTVKISDIECYLKKWSQKLPARYPFGRVDYLLHERFRDAFAKATTVLMNHVKAGILVGSDDERSDLEKLCKCLKGIAPDLEQCFEENAFYSALRGKYSECYDVVSKEDVIARFKILEKVIEAGDLAFNASDNGDDFEVDCSLVEVAKKYVDAVRMWFVDKSRPEPTTFIFKDQKAFERFNSFCAKAPDLFNFCASNKQSTIEKKLWQDGWSYWEQKNYQTTWVDSEGYTSLRIKDDGEFTVSFLSESPYFRDGSLDRAYLGKRWAELIKYAPVLDIAFFIPASLKDDITGFWTAGTKYLQVAGANKVMDFGHGKIGT